MLATRPETRVEGRRVISIVLPVVFFLLFGSSGAGKTVVYSYSQGVAALKAGKQIQYLGAAGAIKFDHWHNSFPDQAMQKVTPDGAPISSVTIPAAEIQKLA